MYSPRSCHSALSRPLCSAWSEHGPYAVPRARSPTPCSPPSAKSSQSKEKAQDLRVLRLSFCRSASTSQKIAHDRKTEGEVERRKLHDRLQGLHRGRHQHESSTD